MPAWNTLGFLEVPYGLYEKKFLDLAPNLGKFKLLFSSSVQVNGRRDYEKFFLSFFLSFLLIVPVSVSWAQEPPVSSPGGRAQISDVFLNPASAGSGGRVGPENADVSIVCNSTLTPPPIVSYSLTVTYLDVAPPAVIYTKQENLAAGGGVVFNVPPPNVNAKGEPVWLTPRNYVAKLTVTQGGVTGTVPMQFSVQPAGPGFIKINPNDNGGMGN